jgi:hypothetical protein
VEVLSETEVFHCVWNSAWSPTEDHNITVYAEFDLSKDEEGDTVAEMTHSSWYDTRGEDGFHNMKDRPISRTRAAEISSDSLDRIEMEAYRAALECEW